MIYYRFTFLVTPQIHKFILVSLVKLNLPFTRGFWLICSWNAAMWRSKHILYLWVEIESGQSVEWVWLCVTDLWCIARVIVFTTPFHHVSPYNTWGSQNYISLAILCKIFTFSFLPMRLVVLMCARTKRHWRSWKEAAVMEACLRGRMSMYSNVFIL